MQVRAGIVVALAVLATAPAADPHAGHGATWIGISQFKYTPDSATIYAGDSVLWTWNGPDTDHSVTADAGQSMQFDSDAGKSDAQILHPVNDGYGVTFNEPGSYRYHCRVHSSMTGTITVVAAAGGSGSGATSPPSDTDPAIATPAEIPLGSLLAVVGAGLAAFVLARRRFARD